MKNLSLKKTILFLFSFSLIGKELKAMEQTTPPEIYLRLVSDFNKNPSENHIWMMYDVEELRAKTSSSNVKLITRAAIENIEEYEENVGFNTEHFDHLMTVLKNPELKKFFWEGYKYEESGKLNFATVSYNQMFSGVSQEERKYLFDLLTEPKKIQENYMNSEDTRDQIKNIIESFEEYKQQVAPSIGVLFNRSLYYVNFNLSYFQKESSIKNLRILIQDENKRYYWQLKKLDIKSSGNVPLVIFCIRKEINYIDQIETAYYHVGLTPIKFSQMAANPSREENAVFTRKIRS